MKKTDVLIVGSGMGSLTAAVLLAHKGLKVTVIEQNWQAGGCTGSYWRKGFVFDTGATTLVGLGEGMPLQYVLEQTGIHLPARQLNLPMQVHLSNGEVVNRYQGLSEWISEAQRVFGKAGQRPFWEEAFRISQFVWKNSLKQKLFPPSSPGDLLSALGNLSVEQIRHIPSAFKPTSKLLKKHGLLGHEIFRKFVDEQLLITAQNSMGEVNSLFGATALCYTNYPNFYLDGGLINLVTPFAEYLESKGGDLVLRQKVSAIRESPEGYNIIIGDQVYQSQYVISGIPVNNSLDLVDTKLQKKLSARLLKSEELNSAFQMGIGFKAHRPFESIHHQIHLSEPLSQIGSKSIFVSLNHPEDTTRSDKPGLSVMSISTHIPNPEDSTVDSQLLEKEIVGELVKRGFLLKEHIIYQHSSSPGSWEKWTGRKWGFVGGYPQYMAIKPWQMLDARLDGKKAYMVGDTVYPGQGIPGVTLSGVIAVEKMSKDWGI